VRPGAAEKGAIVKKSFLLPILIGLSSFAVAGLAQPSGASFRGISVGADNLIRVGWGYSDGTGEGFQVETVDSDGNVIALGPKNGPYAQWAYSGIATGPSNNTIVGLITRNAQAVALCQMDSANNFVEPTFGNYYNPAPQNWPSIHLNAVDASDNAWFLVSVADPSSQSTPYTYANLESFAISSGAAGTRYSYNSWEMYQNLTVRNDDTKCFLGQGVTPGPAPNHTYVTCAVTSGGSRFVQLLSQPPIPTGVSVRGSVYWYPYMISATPNNHVQLYWTRWDSLSGSIQYSMAIWDIAPDGTTTYSPAYSFADWIPWEAAASAFTGGDGRLRMVYYHVPSHQLAVATFDPATWELTNVAYL
jgi:hypothetical protein